MYQIKQSTTAYPLVFLMVSSTDHVTAVTGITPTVTISKAGGTFASPSGTVSEIANGWYKVAGNTTDSNTLGPIILHATGTGADPSNEVYEVVAYDPQSSTVTVGSMSANTITASAVATDAVTEIQSGLATSSSLTSVANNVSAIKTKTDQMVFGVANQLDVNVESINTTTVLGSGISSDKWRA